MDKHEPESRPTNSQTRVRNILTLEERVRAIHAYDRKPMYTKIASMFQCSWEQIKNIIHNRKAILDFYEATKRSTVQPDPDKELIRQRKVNFLGECLYEYIQRAQYHKKADVTEEIIRMKAIEFRELIQIDKFLPVRAWINQFKATYNIRLSQRQITLTRTPPASLDLKDIMTYCSRYKSKAADPSTASGFNGYPLYKMATTMAISTANDATLEEIKQRRQRKINFLMKALYEYIQRSQYHHRMTLNEEHLRKIACELKDMLKIDDFYPNKAWFNHFKSIYDFSTSQRTLVFTRAPPFSLDLKDILSYCSRHDAKNQPTEPKCYSRNKLPLKVSQGDKMLSVEKSPALEQPKIRVINHTHLAAVKTIEIPDDNNEHEVDIKPNLAEIEEIKLQNEELVEEPPLKKPKLEIKEDEIDNPAHSPGHWSEHSGGDEEELPKKVRNYTDALKLLKPLEEFAMLQENYRAIGLVSQLEEIFKNPTKS